MEDQGKIFSNFFRILSDLFTLACFFVFSFLIALDGWRAFTKRANWFPGKAFALTGVTVQIIVWWTSFSNIAFYKFELEDRVVLYQLVVNGRVAVCVFIGYLLPGMAAPGFTSCVALAISVCAQIGSEFLFLRAISDKTYQKKVSWSKLADQILFISIIVLCLILTCTVLAGKTVHRLLKERISAVFSTDKEEEFQLSTINVGNERTISASWDDFEDESFKSWLAVRVCQVDYVICRSVLNSAAGIVVTISVIVFMLANTYHNKLPQRQQIFRVFITSPIASFILLGWIVIYWRCLAAHLYFSSHRCSLKRYLYVEDFWTTSIVQRIDIYDLKEDRQRSADYETPSTKMFSLSRLNGLQTKLKLHKLLYLVVMLQFTVIFFSKLCGLLSDVITGKFMYWCMYWCYKRLRKGDQFALPEKYAKILDCICMPGENPSYLWQANKGSIDKIRLRMRRGQEKGRECEQINSNHYSLQWVDDGTKLLHSLKKNALPSVLKHFPNVEKRPWKITVVSLISIILRLQKGNVDIATKALKSCHEVWDFLNFMDEADIEVDDISVADDFNRDTNQVSMAADKEFYRLQIKYGKLGSQKRVIDVETAHSISKECNALLARENLLGETQQNNQGKTFVAELSDSKDWTEIALMYNLYKLCKVMVDDGVEDFVAWAEISLRNIIAVCVSELPDLLVKQCWKWAEGFEEDKLWKAIYLASKLRGMMEAPRLQPKLVFSPTMKWTLHASDHVEE